MARRTFTKLQTTTKDYISQPTGSVASSTVANFIKEHLNAGYHLVQAELRGYIMQDLPLTASTEEDEQYYYYPPGVYPPITEATLEIGDVAYPLKVIESQKEWNRINQVDFSGMTIPQYIFPRRDDFGVYPIPAADGDTITFVGNMLDRDMSVEDYTDGTVTATQNDETITGSSTTWVAGMAGRWFATDADLNWYRIATFTSTTSMELETVFEATTAAGGDYTIGECPEIPPELHQLLPHYAAAQFFSGPRKDFGAAQAHLNQFWTGDFSNSSRRLLNVHGGLLGAKLRYSSRSESAIVKKRGGRAEPHRFQTDVWANPLE